MRFLQLFFLGIAAFSTALAQDLPVDKKATIETINLYRNLKKTIEKGILFGHQDDLAYGHGWSYEKGRSDVKEVTGDYPAVYGWELGRIEVDTPDNLDGVPFDAMKEFIREGYARGAVITVSWHMNNPLTGKTTWDPAPGTVASILPGGQKHDLYKSWLDKVAAFFLDLKGSKGEFIPVIFRPFHELNGNWFWWGKNHCTPDEIKQLYRFTAGYLRNEKNIHHLLYAFNTDRFGSREDYLERYPGDEWVDVIGLDIYYSGTDHAKFITDIDSMLSTLVTIATEKNKIPALTEFGFNQVPVANWWTKTFWKGIEKHPISFVLAWRNAGLKDDETVEYYVPFKGQVSAYDFLKFYKLERTLFGNEVLQQNLYR